MRPNIGKLRSVILGIGNELNGDDAAGVLVTKQLRKEIDKQFYSDVGQPNTSRQEGAVPEVLIIDAGLAPENFTGTVRRFQPQLVILIDTADLAQSPGSWAWVDWQKVEGFGGSTHLLPLSVFASYLVNEFGCQVALIGIQPAQTNFGSQVSMSVMVAVREIVQELASEIRT